MKKSSSLLTKEYCLNIFNKLYTGTSFQVLNHLQTSKSTTALTKGDKYLQRSLLRNCSLLQSIDLGSYSPTILKNVLSLVQQIFLSLAAFECNTTSDWLNHTVQPIRSFVTFKFTNLGEKDRMFFRMVGEYGLTLN